MKQLVYIAGPISKGDMLHNLRQADEAFFALLRAGFAPINPMWSVYAGSAVRLKGDVVAVADATPNGTTHEDWMGIDLPMVSSCVALLRLPGESKGADMEAAHAGRCGIPVFMSVESLVAWAKNGGLLNAA